MTAALPPCACGHLQCLHIPAAASAGRCTGAGCDCRTYVRRTTLPDEHMQPLEESASTRDWNPTDDELRAIVDDIRIGSWARDLARLVLREREERDNLRRSTETLVETRNSETARLAAIVGETSYAGYEAGTAITCLHRDLIAERARAEQAEAALARMEHDVEVAATGWLKAQRERDRARAELAEAGAAALRDAAAAARGMHDPPAPDCVEWADWLCARAAIAGDTPRIVPGCAHACTDYCGEGRCAFPADICGRSPDPLLRCEFVAGHDGMHHADGHWWGGAVRAAAMGDMRPWIEGVPAEDTPPAAGYGADMGTNGPAAALQRILTDHDVHDLDAHDVIAVLADAGLTIIPEPGEHIGGTIPGVTGYTVAELRAVWQSMLDGSVHPLREKRLACMAVGLVNQMQPLRDALAVLPAWNCPACGAETRARMADRPTHLPLDEVIEIAADLARRASTPPGDRP